jgi:hypothetical protein
MQVGKGRNDTGTAVTLLDPAIQTLATLFPDARPFQIEHQAWTKIERAGSRYRAGLPADSDSMSDRVGSIMAHGAGGHDGQASDHDDSHRQVCRHRSPGHRARAEPRSAG